MEVADADHATEIAVSFLKKHYPLRSLYPKHAALEANMWIVEVDIGLLVIKIAKVKIDTKTGEIVEYDIP